MKTKNKIITSILTLTLGITTSCSGFLDTLPDQRAELNSTKKVKDILISAYPTLVPMMLFELRTDDVTDNGELFSMPGNVMSKSYRWEDIGEDDWDSPQEVWDACYKAIASANQALEAIELLGTPEDCLPYKAEALMCRAYGHFVLANTFCMPYDATSAATLQGIPYIMTPEKSVTVVYTRGTLENVYKNLDTDIETALPYITDEAYTVPLYHFNKRAAYAFAARFNLFYGNPAKTVAYATEALGAAPAKSLRDLNGYSQFTKPGEWTVAYLRKEQACNIMLIVNRTMWGRNYKNTRYGHSKTICSETFWSKGPWKGGNADELGAYSSVFGPDQGVFLPKCEEMFEITNQTAQTGQPHVTAFAFTTDETIITRAEGYALLKEYEKAASDLSDWYVSKESTIRCTAQDIVNFYSTANVKTVAKPLNPKFITLEPGMQTSMIQAVLHARRIETIHEGKRWLDIRRYGIEITHPLANTDPQILTPFDKRLAIQIPDAVASAGLDKNPR